MRFRYNTMYFLPTLNKDVYYYYYYLLLTTNYYYYYYYYHHYYHYPTGKKKNPETLEINKKLSKSKNTMC